MEHKIKSETSPYELDIYTHNGFTQIRVQSGNMNSAECVTQMYVDIKPKELRQFIECLELLEKQLK